MAMFLSGRGTPMDYGEETVPRVDADEAQRLISEGALLVDFGDPDECAHLLRGGLRAWGAAGYRLVTTDSRG